MPAQKFFLHAMAVSMALGGGQAALAQSYPAAPVKIIVPFAAGGGVDQVARMLASHWQTAFKGNFIVENRPGASTFIAAEAVARAVPDGTTLLLTTQSTFVINPLLFKEMPYKASDFVPVGRISAVPSFFTVAADSPFKSLADLVASAKERPGSLSYASAGAGTAGHLGFELLNQRVGTRMIHAPYKSYAASMPDVVAGRVTSIMADLPVINSLLQAGKVRLLAASTARRSEFMPDVPSVNEALGIKDFSVANWFAVYAPKGTPADVVARLSKEIEQFTRSPEGAAKLKAIGHTPAASSPRELAELERAEAANWGPLIKSLNLKMD
ncbi:MAG: tripartite tricarboxylate transporter substrate binding protein [Burkholderiales bacterium]|nr:tripartite tricarboxylate transporter substrate binding protein [Burkholderiales bacterium]